MVVARIKEDDVTVDDRRSDTGTVRAPPLWLCALLGLVMSAAGISRFSPYAAPHSNRGKDNQCRHVESPVKYCA
jgi:hypothetical protein